MRRSVAALAALVLAAGTAACAAGEEMTGDQPDLTVSDPYVRQPPLDDMAAGYLKIDNAGPTADRLIAAEADIADEVELHTTADGVMKKVQSLSIPANGHLELRMGGDHLMLMGLQRKPAVGDTVTFTLRFATSSPMEVEAPVRPTDHRPDPHEGHSDHPDE